MKREQRVTIDIEEFTSMFGQADLFLKHGTHDQRTHGSWASGSSKLTIMGKNDGTNEFFNEKTRVVRFQPEGKEPVDYVLYVSDSFSSSFVVALVKPTDGTTINGYSESSTNKGEVGHLDVTSSQNNAWRRNSNDGKATVVEVAVQKAHQRRGLASAMLKFHRDRYPELDVQHSDAQLPDGKAWAEVAKHGEHDQSTHGNWAHGGAVGITGLIDRLSEKKTPGFTIDIRSKKSPKTGYMCSDEGKEKSIPISEFFTSRDASRKYLKDYLNQNIESLSKKGAYFGAWVDKDTNKVYLDVSRRYDTRASAVEAGIKNSQKSVYDIERDSYIYMEDKSGRTNKARFGGSSETSQGNDGSGEGRFRGRDSGSDRGQSLKPSAHICLGRGLAVEKHLQGLHDQATHGAWAGDRYPENSVKGARDGAKEFVFSKGMELDETIDYKTVVANRERASKIADAYDKLPEKAKDAIDEYEALSSEVEEQFDFMTKNLGIKVEFVADDPYKTSKEMFADASRGVLKVLSTASTGAHQLFSDSQNDKFRAVHDFFGHAATGRGFGQDGEEAAWVHHSQMFTEKARGALTTETRGQNSWYNTRNQGFADQKVALLPEEFWQVPKAFSKIKVIKFAAGLRPVFKHQQHDQKTHGSWANYTSEQRDLIESMKDKGPSLDDLNSFAGSNEMDVTTGELERLVNETPELYSEAVGGIDELVAYRLKNLQEEFPNHEYTEQEIDTIYENVQNEMIAEYIENENDGLRELVVIQNGGGSVGEEEMAQMMSEVYEISHEGTNREGVDKVLDSRIGYIASNGDGEITVSGIVRDENEDYAGEFGRRFFKGTNPDTGEETWNVEHELLKMEDEAAGTGFGKKFIEQQEAYYTSKGMGYIEVGTAWDGARHWARAGYDWNPTEMISNAEQLVEMRGRISTARDIGRLSETDATDALTKFDSLMDRFVTGYKVEETRSSTRVTFDTTRNEKSDDFPLPADFANIGYTKGARSWAASEAMYGLRMKYVKVLTAEGQNLLNAPIDRDGDGMIFDGTARERPAPTNN